MDKISLDSFYDPNVNLSPLNTAGFMQFQSFDNSLIENEQFEVFSLMNTPSISTTHTDPRISSFNADPIALYTNQTMGPNVMSNTYSSSPLGTRFSYSDGLNMNNIGSSILSYVEQPMLSSSLQTPTLASSGPQVARKKQPQKGLFAKRHNSFPDEIIHDPINVAQRLKKPRLDMSEESILAQSVSQQALQTVRSQSNMHKHQIPGLVQQYMLQSAPSCDVLNQPESQPMSNQMQQQVIHGVNDAEQFNEGMFTMRVMQYINHLRRRPADNNLAYWRELFREYFVPGAKKRWCVSLYEKVGRDAKSVCKSAMSVWKCDMCGCGAGRGFEVISESLPRVTKLMFESGVIDELLFLDLPQAYRLPSGLVMLKYEKVTQESVHEKFRVVHEGQLCVVFTRDLKILSWEFCARRHEVFVSRNLVMSQINKADQKYQNDINDYKSNGTPLQDLQANRNRFQKVASWMVNALDLGLVDDLGLSRSYSRCLQISEVVQSMDDVMTFSRANQMGPIESLKNFYPEFATTSKLQKQEMGKKHIECRDLSTDNSIPASNMVKERLATSSEEATSALLGRTNNKAATFQGPRMSSSSRRDHIKEHAAVMKIVQEMINSNNNGAASESARQVSPSMPVRMYDIREAETAPANTWGPSKLSAGPSTGFSEPAVSQSQSSSMGDQV